MLFCSEVLPVEAEVREAEAADPVEAVAEEEVVAVAAVAAEEVVVVAAVVET